MKDLFLLTADADALAFMKSLLARHQALGISCITYELMRHPMRDSGVIKDGPETARLYRGKFQRAILLWDHQGSGQERSSPEDASQRVQTRLDSVSWQSKSGAVVIVPELEEWLWHSYESISQYFNLELSRLTDWIGQYAARKRMAAELPMRKTPKELFEYVCIEKLKRTISPRDFEEIGKMVNIGALQESNSFSRVVRFLREWFPS
jgi:hypothetical protein